MSMANNPEAAKWLGLLKWSMQYDEKSAFKEGDNEIDLSKAPETEISDEDKAFLNNVMKECVINEVERMQQITRILRGEDPREVFGAMDQKDAEESITDISKEEIMPTPKKELDQNELADYKEGLLEELLTRVDQIDNAKTFVKWLHGLNLMMVLMESSDRPMTRGLAAEVLATLMQNNPEVQMKAVEDQVLPALYKLYSYGKTLEGSDRALVQAKAILAMSALVRNHDLATGAFMHKGQDGQSGINLLLDAAQPGNALKVQRKGVFLLRYFVSSSSARAEKLLISDGEQLMSALGSVIQSDDLDLSENGLQTLINFIQHGTKFQEIACKGEFGLLPKTNEALASTTAELEKLETSGGDPYDIDAAKAKLVLLRELHTSLTAKFSDSRALGVAMN